VRTLTVLLNQHYGGNGKAVEDKGDQRTRGSEESKLESMFQVHLWTKTETAAQKRVVRRHVRTRVSGIIRLRTDVSGRRHSPAV